MSYIYCKGRHPMVHKNPPRCNQNPRSSDCKVVSELPDADKCNICFPKKSTYA